MYHPLRTQMTVVNVYSSCTGIKNLSFFHREKAICGPDQSTLLTKFDSFRHEDLLVTVYKADAVCFL